MKVQSFNTILRSTTDNLDISNIDLTLAILNGHSKQFGQKESTIKQDLDVL